MRPAALPLSICGHRAAGPPGGGRESKRPPSSHALCAQGLCLPPPTPPPPPPPPCDLACRRPSLGLIFWSVPSFTGSGEKASPRGTRQELGGLASRHSHGGLQPLRSAAHARPHAPRLHGRRSQPGQCQGSHQGHGGEGPLEGRQQEVPVGGRRGALLGRGPAIWLAHPELCPVSGLVSAGVGQLPDLFSFSIPFIAQTTSGPQKTNRYPQPTSDSWPQLFAVC